MPGRPGRNCAGENKVRGLLCALSLVWITGCSKAPPPATATLHSVRVLERRPHDPEVFTQGLVWDGDVWLESGGLYGRSELREVDRASSTVLRRHALEPALFGEGLALQQGRLYQLTWREGLCLVYDRETFAEVRRFRYEGEGWGLASDGTSLYMSDGSSTIRVLDPETFREMRRMVVTGPQGPVTRLNELECVRGELWANVFGSGWIVRIRPGDGQVIGFVDVRDLPVLEDRHEKQDVLNGIAWDPEADAVWVTGKFWKSLYRIEIVESTP